MNCVFSWKIWWHPPKTNVIPNIYHSELDNSICLISFGIIVVMLLISSYDQRSMADHHHLMHIMTAKTFKIQKLGQKHDYKVFQLRKSHLKLRLKWKALIKYELKRLSYLTYHRPNICQIQFMIPQTGIIRYTVSQLRRC